MSELTPPEPKPPEPPRRDRRIAWPAIGSAALHAAVLVFLLWQPPPYNVQAAPPPAIDVELVPPPEAPSAPEPTVEEPGKKASETTTPPVEKTPAEPPPAEQAAGPSATDAPAAEIPSEKVTPETASEAATAPSEPVRSLETPVEEAPNEPATLGSVSEEAVSAVADEPGGTAEGTTPSAPADQPDVATLKLGALHSAEHFYLKEMLSVPSMARARAMLKTLPSEKRLLQTCNIEALAQIGNAGEGFAPDVVMAQAYAGSEITGTRVAANGAIFRSGERWYGLAFDCTLSADLSKVTAFSYRLGADVTDAVLARLSKT